MAIQTECAFAYFNLHGLAVRLSPPAKFFRISEHLVAYGAVDVDDESDAARIFLQAWVIQTLRLVKRWFYFLKNDHLPPAISSWSRQRALCHVVAN